MLSTGSIRYFSKKINLFVNTCMCVLMPYFHKIATKTRRTNAPHRVEFEREAKRTRVGENSVRQMGA